MLFNLLLSHFTCGCIKTLLQPCNQRKNESLLWWNNTHLGRFLFVRKKIVFRVGYQMESLMDLSPMDLFRKMWNIFRGTPLFSFLLERPKNQVTICYSCASWWNTWLHRWGINWNSPFNLKVLEYCQVVDTHPVSFCLLKTCSVPFGVKFSPGFPCKWKAFLCISFPLF